MFTYNNPKSSKKTETIILKNREMLRKEAATTIKKKISHFLLKTLILKEIYFSFKELFYQSELKQKYKINQSNLIIYTMGKVGSTSLYEFFKHRSSLNVFHVHHLNINYLKKRKKALNKSAEKYLKQPHLWTDLLWKPIWINKTLIKDNHQNIFITLIRNPVKRNESLFFQHMDIKKDGDLFHCKSRSNLYPYSISFSKEDITPLIDVYFTVFNYYTHIMWFKDEFEFTFKTDIRHLDIINGQKYWYIKELNLIIIKLEYLNETFNEVSTLIDEKIDNNDFVPANTGADKTYSELYEKFKKEVIYSKDFVEKIYNSEYIKKFYTQSEIEKFKQKITITE